MKILSWALFCGAALLVGCESWPKISSTYLQGTDYTRYRTFAVMQRVGVAPGADADPELANRVRGAARAALIARGFKETDAAMADFLVMVQGRITPRVNLAEYGYDRLPARPWRYAGGFAPGLDSPMWDTSISVANAGRLAVDIIDAKSRELIWRGVARKERIGDQPDPERIAAAVGLILRRFPSPAD